MIACSWSKRKASTAKYSHTKAKHEKKKECLHLSNVLNGTPWNLCPINQYIWKQQNWIEYERHIQRTAGDPNTDPYIRNAHTLCRMECTTMKSSTNITTCSTFNRTVRWATVLLFFWCSVYEFGCSKWTWQLIFSCCRNWLCMCRNSV